jgi:Fur family ferric uptake transcriptional regulator
MVDPHARTANTAPTADEVAEVLARHGYRMTRPRQAVVAAVLARAKPFTAEQVVADMKVAEPGLGRATVYRTLEILASVDVLTRLLQPGGHPAYVVGVPGHRHHLVCSECGDTVAFTACPVDELVQVLTRDTEFAIHGHLLEVFGVCPECQDEEPGPEVPEDRPLAAPALAG